MYLFVHIFTKLWNTTISYVISLGPSVCMEQLGSHLTDVHEIWNFRIYQKSFEKIWLSLQSSENRALDMKIYVHLLHLAQFLLELYMFCIKVV